MFKDNVILSFLKQLNSILLLLFLQQLLFAQKPVSSSYGKVLSPHGDLRILVIFAGFDGFDHNQPYHNWGYGNALPSFDINQLFFTDFGDFEKYKNDTANTNLSRYYYEHSNAVRRLRIVADIFPERINIWNRLCLYHQLI